MSLPTNRRELRDRWQAGEQFEFFLFYGHKQHSPEVDASCFSQWFERDFSIDGIEYSTAEHWMMAEKARLFEDQIMLDAILDAPGPKEAKAFGRKVKNFDNVVWDEHRIEIVKRGNIAKFSQNEDLKQFLLATAESEELSFAETRKVAELKTDYAISSSNDSQIDDLEIDPNLVLHDAEANEKKLTQQGASNVILVEAAGRDVIWGIGLGRHNPKSQDPFTWRGRNLLGFALTEVREQLASEGSKLTE